MPLGEGQVEPKYGEMLMKIGYSGPIPLHGGNLHGDPESSELLKSWLGWA